LFFGLFLTVKLAFQNHLMEINLYNEIFDYVASRDNKTDLVWPKRFLSASRGDRKGLKSNWRTRCGPFKIGKIDQKQHLFKDVKLIRNKQVKECLVRVVQTEDDIEKLISECHQAKGTAEMDGEIHLSRDDTILRFDTEYYLQDSNRMIRDYVKNCEVCQQRTCSNYVTELIPIIPAARMER